MNSGPLLFLGAFFSLAMSFWGLIVAPNLQIGQQQEVTSEATGERYPVARPGLAQLGADIYRANGCNECHTLQVRPKELGYDLERGWGIRRTVAQDYLRDYPVLLGDLRLGPDLSNIGSRQLEANWHLRHLYDPKSTSPGSMMPPYRYLFDTRPLPVGEEPASDAIAVGLAGYEIRPRPEAVALSAYLLSLRAQTPLFEAPVPQLATNDVPTEVSGTNASASAEAPINPASLVPEE